MLVPSSLFFCSTLYIFILRRRKNHRRYPATDDRKDSNLPSSNKFSISKKKDYVKFYQHRSRPSPLSAPQTSFYNTKWYKPDIDITFFKYSQFFFSCSLLLNSVGLNWLFYFFCCPISCISNIIFSLKLSWAAK